MANYLLLRSSIGQVRPTSRDLPQIGHSYGKPNRKDQFNVKELLTSWNQTESTVANSSTRDFAKMNKLAIAQHVVNAKEAATFRKDNDCILPKRYKSRPHGMQDVPLSPLLTHGLPNRTATPVKGIIEGRYFCNTELNHVVSKSLIVETFSKTLEQAPRDKSPPACVRAGEAETRNLNLA